MSLNFEPVSMVRAFSEWPEKVQKAARNELRRQLAEGEDLKKNINVNVILEQTWNAICAASGHDGKVEQQNQLRRNR